MIDASLFSEKVLGKYFSGSFFSETSFPEGFETYPLASRYTLIDLKEKSKVNFEQLIMQSYEDSLATMVFIHESIHYLQDLTIGYGHLRSYFSRNWPGLLKNLFSNLQTKNVSVPLKDWEPANEHDKILLKNIKKEIFSEIQFLRSLSSPQKGKHPVPFKIDAKDILEGMAFYISRKYVLNELKKGLESGYDVSKAWKAIEISYYPPVYKMAKNYFDFVLKSHDRSNNRDDDLFILVCDLALHIPSIDDILSLVVSGKNKMVDFKPGYRFVEATKTLAKKCDKFQGDVLENYKVYIDEICKNTHLKWPLYDETTESLISRLKRQKEKSPNDFSIDLQIRASEVRMIKPFLFIGSLHKAFEETKFVMTYFTQKEPRWISYYYESMGDTYEKSDAYKTLIMVWHKIFLRYITSQLYWDKRLSCPFLSFPLECKMKRKECNSIDPKDDFYKHNCYVRDLMKTIFGIELERINYLR